MFNNDFGNAKKSTKSNSVADKARIEREKRALARVQMTASIDVSRMIIGVGTRNSLFKKFDNDVINTIKSILQINQVLSSQNKNQQFIPPLDTIQILIKKFVFCYRKNKLKMQNKLLEICQLVILPSPRSNINCKEVLIDILFHELLNSSIYISSIYRIDKKSLQLSDNGKCIFNTILHLSPTSDLNQYRDFLIKIMKKYMKTVMNMDYNEANLCDIINNNDDNESESFVGDRILAMIGISNHESLVMLFQIPFFASIIIPPLLLGLLFVEMCIFPVHIFLVFFRLSPLSLVSTRIMKSSFF